MDIANLNMLNNGRSHSSGKRRGFTLVELLVVLAISVLLFGLLLGPLVNAFRLTQRAQLLTAAQDSARTALEQITRELGSATYVYDNNSHLFVKATNTSTTLPNDVATNFLDLTVPDANNTAVVEHAYNAKVDLVPARHAGGSTGTSDPTAGDEPVRFQQGIGSATLAPSGLIFPLGPSSTIVRIWIGLKDPTKPYANSNEGQLTASTGSGDNTYVLLRAQVPVYNPIDPATGKPAANADKTIINERFFAPKIDAKTGQPKVDTAGNPTNEIEFDDPDFYRYVATSDVNWLDDTHANYADVVGHNTRVDNWFKVAKQIITAPDIDLILLPHDQQNNVAYKGAADPYFPNVAYSSVIHDPVGNKDYPVLNTSVTFRPASVTADASANTNGDYIGAGVPANAADAEGLPYIPTVYTASGQSWSYPYHVTLDPLYGTTGAPDEQNHPYFDTALDPATGDIMEFLHTKASDQPGLAVFDLTTQKPTANGKSGHKYVPMSVDPRRGTVNFATVALPDPNTPSDPYFKALPFEYQAGSGDYIVDLTNTDSTSTANTFFPDTPLYRERKEPVDTGMPTLATLGGSQVLNAHIVPGSLRVYGPDIAGGLNTAGTAPLNTQPVLYQQVTGADTLGDNQYRVDYHDSILHFRAPSGGPQYGSGTGTSPFPTPEGPNGPLAAPIYISFQYQANLAPTVNSPLDASMSSLNTALSLSNPALPMDVRVDYQTRDLLSVNIGVRVYDPSNGQAQIVYVNNKVKIGNSNR